MDVLTEGGRVSETVLWMYLLKVAVLVRQYCGCTY